MNSNTSVRPTADFFSLPMAPLISVLLISDGLEKVQKVTITAKNYELLVLNNYSYIDEALVNTLKSTLWQVVPVINHIISHISCTTLVL